MRMKIFLNIIDFNLRDYVLDDPFVYTHFINNEVVNKLKSLWTTKEKEKVKNDFKIKYLMIITLSIKEDNYIFKYNTVKEVYYTLEMI